MAINTVTLKGRQQDFHIRLLDYLFSCFCALISSITKYRLYTALLRHSAEKADADEDLLGSKKKLCPN